MLPLFTGDGFVFVLLFGASCSLGLGFSGGVRYPLSHARRWQRRVTGYLVQALTVTLAEQPVHGGPRAVGL